MGSLGRDTRGSAVQWFALAAAVLSVASLAGAQGLAWLSQPGRVALVAYGGPQRPSPVLARADVDPMPTGSIPSNTVMIRLR